MHIPKMTTINDLPNEILHMIFQKVKGKKQFTLTCKRWNKLIVNFLYLSIDLSTEERIRKFRDIIFTRTYRQNDIYVAMLVPSDFDWTDSSQQLRLPRSDGTSSLESSVIRFGIWYKRKSEGWIIDRIESMELITEEGLKEISEMPNLKRLEYDDNRSKGDQTDPRKVFDAIARKAKAITEIYMSCDYHACYSDFRIIRSLSTQLQHLSCTVYPIYVKDFLQLSLPVVKSLYLDFGPCTIMPGPGWFFKDAKLLVDLNVTNINNDEFFRKGVYCSAATVERLTITGNQQIPMDGLQSLIGLKELKLCEYVGSEVQNAVPRSTSLEKLVIQRCTSGFSFYGVLAESVPHITELHITEDAALNDECLRVICTTMPNLRRLKLKLGLFLRDPVTDRGLHYIGNLRQLEYLSLECFDDADLIMGRNDLIGFGWAPLLWASEIHLNGFPMINVQNVLDFLLNPNLQSLSLEQCGRNVNMIDTVRKIKQLMAVSRPLPHLEIADFW